MANFRKWGMVRRFVDKLADENALTLVELLVVMLILGVLAGIALPSYLAQSDKANDADAKQAAGTAQTAIEIVASDNDGEYSGITADDLVEEEPTLSGALLSEPVTTDDTFTVEVSSSTGQRFQISRDALGRLDFDCAVRDRGGCPADGNWGD